jgi:hypothetical protein
MTERVETLLKIGLGPFGKVSASWLYLEFFAEYHVDTRPTSYSQGTLASLCSV